MTKKVIVQSETKVSTEKVAVMLDSTNAAELIAKFNEAKEVMKQMTEQKEAAEKALRDLMGDAEVGLIAGVGRVFINTRNTKNIDKKDLQEVFPEAYELCLKESSYTVLTAVS